MLDSLISHFPPGLTLLAEYLEANLGLGSVAMGMAKPDWARSHSLSLQTI